MCPISAAATRLGTGDGRNELNGTVVAFHQGSVESLYLKYKYLHQWREFWVLNYLLVISLLVSFNCYKSE